MAPGSRRGLASKLAGNFKYPCRLINHLGESGTVLAKVQVIRNHQGFLLLNLVEEREVIAPRKKVFPHHLSKTKRQSI